MRRPLAVCAVSLAASLVIYAPGCADEHDHGAGTAPDDAIYEGGTNDEALAVLTGGTTTTNVEKGPAFEQPASGAVLDGATPATFQWKVATSALFPASIPASTRGSESGGRALEHFPRWANLIGAERGALAHGAPLNGRAYLVVFATAADPKLLRVFTTKTSYTPDATAWSKLKGASGAITATIATAEFEDNRLVSAGGATSGAALTFTIGRP